MEVESFEDENVAEVMNSLFVSIKVDREERPDIDRVYMSYHLSYQSHQLVIHFITRIDLNCCF